MRLPIGLLASFLLLGCPKAQPAESGTATQGVEKYDGAWWQSASQHERSGFVEGVIDCYIGDYRGAPRFENSSIDSYRDRTTAFYQGAPSRVGDLVLQTLLAAGDTVQISGARPTTPLSGHGYFDGLYWMQMHLGGPEEQLGFLKGYLSCYRHFLPNEAKAFTHSPAEYRTLITQWYRFDEATGDVDAERQQVSIAEALRRVNADTASR